MGFFYDDGLNKKGEITTKEILEVLLAAAAVFVLIFLMYSLFVGSFDKDDETAKSYLKTLKREIGVADSGKNGSFDMLNLGNSEVKFYLVYFGERISVKLKDGKDFKSVGNHENHACVCYRKGDELSCVACEDFDYSFKDDSDDGWFIGEDEDAWKIKKDGERYVFFQ